MTDEELTRLKALAADLARLYPDAQNQIVLGGVIRSSKERSNLLLDVILAFPSLLAKLEGARNEALEEAAGWVETMPAMSIGIPKGGFQREAFEMVEYTLKELAKRVRQLKSNPMT